MDAKHANAVMTKSPLKASQVLRASIKKRGGAVGSVSYFYSAKNCRDVVFPNEVCFACALLLEADESVKNYDFDPDRNREHLSDLGFSGSLPTAIAVRWMQRPLLLTVKRDGSAFNLLNKETAQRSAELVGADWRLFDERSVDEHSRLLHDWIQIAPVLAQNSAQVSAQWDFLSQKVRENCINPITLGALRNSKISHWPLVFSTVFRLTQLCVLSTDIGLKPLSSETVVRGRQNGK